jgi:hypothetical protein
MAQVKSKPEDTLYERDFHAWLKDQAAKLRARSHNELDWDNLAEEIDSVGGSERREIRSRLARLVQHLLKWQFQPGRRSESWRITIGEQRTFIPDVIEDSPSLKGFPAEIFEKAYAAGRRDVISETGMLAKIFPVEPPFTVDQALDPKFWPGEPFEIFEIIRD